MAIRLHLDENVHAALAEALRRRGVDVTTAIDAELVGATDRQHLAFARNEGRVIVTHDADFLRLHAGGLEHAGIAFCHARQRSLRDLVRSLSLLAMSLNPQSARNRIQYL